MYYLVVLICMASVFSSTLARGVSWIPGKDVNCWFGCGYKGDSCPEECGENGWCCRKDFTEDNCPQAAREASRPNYHSCVIKSDQYYQLNADGTINCSSDLDCPPDWNDPDVACEEDENEGKQVRICWQTKFSFSCTDNFCYYLESTCVEENSTIVETEQTHTSLKCTAAADFRVVQNSEYDLYDGSYGSGAGADEVYETSAISAQAELNVDDGAANLPLASSISSCPQDTCQRGNNTCCQLAFYRGVFVCPNFC